MHTGQIQSRLGEIMCYYKLSFYSFGTKKITDKLDIDKWKCGQCGQCEQVGQYGQIQQCEEFGHFVQAKQC